MSAAVLIVMMMPAGGLELKQLFAYKMGLVSPCHVNRNQGTCLGMGSQIFGCRLQLLGILVRRFITFSGVVVEDGFIQPFGCISD